MSAPHDEARQAPGRTLLILGLGLLGFVLAQTTVIPALGELQRELGASPDDITWMVTAYLLVACVSTPVFGRLGDMFGKQKLLAVSLGLFAVGSVVAALGDSLGVLVAGRAVQGLGGGVFPLCYAIVRDEFPAARIPTGMALLGAIAAVGSAIGLPLGGVLTDGPGYHWIFIVGTAMGVAAMLSTLLFVPESPVRTPGRVDLVGAAILGGSLVALLLAISRGTEWGWGSARVLGLLAAGVAGLALFGRFETRTASPLVNMRTFSRRAVLTTNVSTLLVGAGMISTFVLVPQLAQLPEGGEVGFGLSATESGLLLVPGGLLSLLVAPFVGKAGEKVGSKVPLLLGCVVVGIALLGMTLAHDSIGLVIAWSALVSIGAGACFAAIPNLVVEAVDARETGEATGVNTIMRNIGSSIGSALAGSLIAAHTLANGLPEDTGFQLAFGIGAVGAIVAGLSVLLIPGRARGGGGAAVPASA